MRLKPRSLDDKNVLIVEDEYMIASDLEKTLRGQGAHVIGPVASVAAALKLIDAHRIDCALLDVNLQGEPVYPVADALRSAGIPYVFTTGYDASSIPSRYEDVPCLTKPIDPEVIAAALLH